MQTSIEKNPNWLDRHAFADVKLNWEKIIFATIVLLAIVTRFYKLGPRVMSHDENSHVYYSWLLYQGHGYQHDPITHGPFQFHIVAASYFIFGAGDISARLPAVLFSIATVAFTWNYRRYIGRAGALIAGLLFTISPYMLYYGRYVRNEAFVAFCGVVLLWAVFRYLETGQSRYLIWVTVANVLHFTIKETSYIYAAELLLFLGLYFVYRITRRPWLKEGHRFWFLISLMAAVVLSGFVVYVLSRKSNGAQPAAESATATETATRAYSGILSHPLLAGLVLVGVVISLAAAVYLLAKGFTWPRVRQERSFDLLIVFGTLVLPLLAAFPLNAIGLNVPTNATSVNAMTTAHILQMSLVVGVLMAIAIGIGLWWNRRVWLINAAIFYAIFTFFYTTYFTNTDGFFTGLLGSLGYWMAQQAVERGTQPWYYYVFLQIPIYEFLPALGSLCALMFLRRKRRAPTSEFPAMELAGLEDISQEQSPTPHVPVIGLLGFWAISSVVVFSYAGEKMPWLTVHITLPLILVAAWAFGRMIETTDWSGLRSVRGRLTLLLLPVLVLSLVGALGILLSTHPPFHGKSTAELQTTGTFFFCILVALASGWGIRYTARGWPALQLRTSLLLTVFALLGVLTARAAFMASYINYDRATEYLVYAHSAPGVKEALTRIEDISQRTTQTLALKVAYDNETSYPYWWYLRDYPNQLGFGANPSRELRDYAVILVGEANYSKVEPVVRQDFYLFDYIRLWWPNEDYKKITWSNIGDELRAESYARTGSVQQASDSMTVFKYIGRVWSKHVGPFFWDARVREAIWDIWLNRDYTKYASLTGHGDLTLSSWSPANWMRMYLNKDVANQLWDYGPQTSASQQEQDPYLGKQVALEADIVLGPGEGSTTQFQNSRAVAIAPDGSLYVADIGSNRIIHLSPEGTELGSWGSPSPGCPYPGDPPAYVAVGTFCEPWGIAVGPDGSVYVADTWNHRIQKFTADGEPLTVWGKGVMSSDSNDLLGFYGPRGIAVDSRGRVFLADTGNSRVVVFDANGSPLMQIGEEGYALGQFAEPVGIALDSAGLLYVADTWNQRVQVFVPTEGSLTPLTSWDIYGWKSNSVNNKPYITVSSDAHVFVTDPEGFRVLEFSNLGEIIRYWGDIGNDATTFGLPTGLVADAQGGVWVSDTDNHRLMHFTLPK